MSPVSLSHPEWDVAIESYVLRTNYEEYAVILMKKKSSFGPSTTLKLYGTTGCGTRGQAGSGLGARRRQLRKYSTQGSQGSQGSLGLEGPAHSFGRALDQLIFSTAEAESHGSLSAVSPSEDPTRCCLRGGAPRLEEAQAPRWPEMLSVPADKRQNHFVQALGQGWSGITEETLLGRTRRLVPGLPELPELCGPVGGWGLHADPLPCQPRSQPVLRPGRGPELREDLIEAFQQLALEMGIPADSVFILANRGDAPQHGSLVLPVSPARARWGCSLLCEAGDVGGRSAWREEGRALWQDGVGRR